MVLKYLTCLFGFMKYEKYTLCHTIIKINRFSTYKKMAKSKFEYVRKFESEDKLLPNCWIVVRLDGKGFHKFTTKHNFNKPNDLRGLNLMNSAAVRVMQEFKDISIAFGESDEYSFVFRKDTEIFNRRGSKIMSYVNSLFSTSYVFYWKEYFDYDMLYPPMFDARIILYPTDGNLRDYLSWRQADVHVNNLYNTAFWTLVLKGGLSNSEAEKRLCGTVSSEKHELLFSEFGINYNNEAVMFKKGTILVKKRLMHKSVKPVQVVIPLHVDLIGDSFWEEHKEILQITNPSVYIWPENEQLPSSIVRQARSRHCLISECQDEFTS